MVQLLTNHRCKCQISSANFVKSNGFTCIFFLNGGSYLLVRKAFVFFVFLTDCNFLFSILDTSLLWRALVLQILSSVYDPPTPGLKMSSYMSFSFSPQFRFNLDVEFGSLS